MQAVLGRDQGANARLAYGVAKVYVMKVVLVVVTCCGSGTCQAKNSVAVMQPCKCRASDDRALWANRHVRLGSPVAAA